MHSLETVTVLIHTFVLLFIIAHCLHINIRCTQNTGAQYIIYEKEVKKKKDKICAQSLLHKG